MKYIFFIISMVCLCSCHSGLNTSISTIPTFNLLLIDSSTVLNGSQIPTGKPTILLFFRPDCTHCQAETSLLLNHIDSLKDVQIYMLANAPLEDIKVFYSQFHLGNYKNFTVGRDFDHSFYRAFHPGAVQYMAIYDSQKSLVKIYGEMPDIEDILKSIHS